MSYTKKIVSAAFAIACVAVVSAQSPRAAFEVVSIKPNTQGGTIMIGNQRGGRFAAMNVNARMLFIMAFRPLQDYQILGGPSWLSTDRFDIEAKGVLTPQESDAAVRAMLEDRFQLHTHRETRELPLYELLISKGGPKIKLVNLPSGQSTGSRPNVPPGAVSSRSGSLVASAISMEQLITALSAVVGRPIIDKTGLTGTFEVNLRYAPDAPIPQQTDSVALPGPADVEASIFTALQEQLGLKLESARGPVEVLVIDSVSKPSEN
jgi:uncharacterized protein (TIGR03435 family)